MRTFKNIGEIVHKGRLAAGLSQTELSRRLDYRQGQFISNVERGLCGIPMHKVERLAKEFDILHDAKGRIVQAMQDDYRHNLYTMTNSYEGVRNVNTITKPE